MRVCEGPDRNRHVQICWEDFADDEGWGGKPCPLCVVVENYTARLKDKQKEIEAAEKVIAYLKGELEAK